MGTRSHTPKRTGLGIGFWSICAVVVLLVLTMAAAVVILAEGANVAEEQPDPAVVDVLPADFPTNRFARLGLRRSPSIVKVTIDLEGATETYLVYPADRPFGDTPPVAAPFMINGDDVIEIERLRAISIQPDECETSCSVTLRLSDPQGVHIFSDGVMAIDEREAKRVPTEKVLSIPLEKPIENGARPLLEICIDGINTDKGTAVARSITLQRRRSDQVTNGQISPVQSRPWPLHRIASNQCQAEFTQPIEHWGGADLQKPALEVTMNVVHWGEAEVDMDAVVAKVTIVDG